MARCFTTPAGRAREAAECRRAARERVRPDKGVRSYVGVCAEISVYSARLDKPRGRRVSASGRLVTPDSGERYRRRGRSLSGVGVCLGYMWSSWTRWWLEMFWFMSLSLDNKSAFFLFPRWQSGSWPSARGGRRRDRSLCPTCARWRRNTSLPWRNCSSVSYKPEARYGLLDIISVSNYVLIVEAVKIGRRVHLLRKFRHWSRTRLLSRDDESPWQLGTHDWIHYFFIKFCLYLFVYSFGFFCKLESLLNAIYTDTNCRTWVVVIVSGCSL